MLHYRSRKTEEDWANKLPDFTLPPGALDWSLDLGDWAKDLPDFTSFPQLSSWGDIAPFREGTAVKSKTDINEK